MPSCICTVCNSARRNTLICLFLYEQYKWIIDTYVLDFYVNDLWDNLPNSWKEYFNELEPSDIMPLLDPFLPLERKKVMPLQLLCLRKLFMNINVSRNAECIGKMYSKSKIHTYKKSMDDRCTISTYKEDDNTCVCDMQRISNETKNIWKRIQAKKKYEICIMANICQTVARDAGCNVIVDFGSGLGHFARILAYVYGFKVCCFEAQESLTKEAEKLDAKFEAVFVKQHPGKAFQRPVHINFTINNSNNIHCLLDMVRTALRIQDDAKFGITGLHPCGDLGALLLKFFKSSHHVVFINVASCCYMKLTIRNELKSFAGYPLSSFVRANFSELSYNARELACHAIENYLRKLDSGNYIELKTHAYRALLEKIIVKYHPGKRHTGLRNVKCSEYMTFYEYGIKALNKLDLHIPEDDLKSPETAIVIKNWHKVVIYYSLRLMFAPIIETLILLDRFLYVADPDTKCALLPVFSPRVSPRTHLFIGTKVFETESE